MLSKTSYLKIKKKAIGISGKTNDWDTYDFFKEMFTKSDSATQEQIILVMSVAYSWMPTMLGIKARYNSRKMKQASDIINSLKIIESKEQLSNNKKVESDLNVLKEIINNSIVGVSKVLHLFSDNAPIIDSRVIRSWNKFFKKEKSKRIANSVKGYLRYWGLILEWREAINKGRNRKVSVREIEKLFYLTGQK